MNLLLQYFNNGIFIILEVKIIKLEVLVFFLRHKNIFALILFPFTSIL